MILAITPTGQLTVRSVRGLVATEGTAVRDRSGAWRGRVLRVFGPVDRPYYSVRLRRTPPPSEGLKLVGSTLVREKDTDDAAG